MMHTFPVATEGSNWPYLAVALKEGLGRGEEDGEMEDRRDVARLCLGLGPFHPVSQGWQLR